MINFFIYHIYLHLHFSNLISTIKDLIIIISYQYLVYFNYLILLLPFMIEFKYIYFNYLHLKYFIIIFILYFKLFTIIIINFIIITI
jgi:hypothetical protein